MQSQPAFTNCDHLMLAILAWPCSLLLQAHSDYFMCLHQPCAVNSGACSLKLQTQAGLLTIVLVHLHLHLHILHPMADRLARVAYCILMCSAMRLSGGVHAFSGAV